MLHRGRRSQVKTCRRRSVEEELKLSEHHLEHGQEDAGYMRIERALPTSFELSTSNLNVLCQVSLLAPRGATEVKSRYCIFQFL